MSKQIRKWIKSKKQEIKNQNLLENNQLMDKNNQLMDKNNQLMDKNNQVMDNQDFKKTIQRLSVRMGEKASKYIPLLRYVSRNPQMLGLLEELVEEAGSMQSSMAKRIFNR